MARRDTIQCLADVARALQDRPTVDETSPKEHVLRGVGGEHQPDGRRPGGGSQQGYSVQEACRQALTPRARHSWGGAAWRGRWTAERVLRWGHTHISLGELVASERDHVYHSRRRGQRQSDEGRRHGGCKVSSEELALDASQPPAAEIDQYDRLACAGPPPRL